MHDQKLIPIADKVYSGIRLTEEDALTLFDSKDLVGIGKLADFANRRINGNTVYYNINRHINPTNIGALSCKFCAFSRKPGEEGAYAYSIPEILEKAGQAVSQGATEIHMVGGLHPRWPFKTYLDMISAIHQAHPEVHIKAFTIVELDWMARRERRTIGEILSDLRNAGLGSLPGGGAEIFHPEIREKICDTKVTAEQWIDTHRLAHSIGMRSNCTMLYGHIESYFHRVDHMRRLRELQDETKGFNVFIPLSFQPFDNEMGVDRYTFGFDDLKTLAVARLYLDNFKNIKAYWIMLGQDTAQLGLSFGANDFDGTVTEEKISRMAGGRSGMSMSRADLESLIRRCGRNPVERDTLYNPVRPADQLKNSLPNDHRDHSLNKTPAASDFLDLSNSELSSELLSNAAITYSLFDLAELAQKIVRSSTSSSSATYSPAIVIRLTGLKLENGLFLSEAAFAPHNSNANILPATVVLDCGGIFDDVESALRTANGLPAVSIEAVTELISKSKRKHPGASLVFAGLRSLSFLAHKESMPLTELVVQLRNAGVDLFESSAAEREYDLSPAEISKLHESCHDADVMTVGKVDLVASPQDGGAPLWEAFARQLLSLRDISLKTQGIKAIQVIVAPHSQITAAEYLRAIALARIAMPNDCVISAPITSIPTHSPGSSIGKDGAQHPAEKTASIVFTFGAGDLGHIPMSNISCLRVAEDIASSGTSPRCRSGKFDTLDMPSEFQRAIDGLQHQPMVH